LILKKYKVVKHLRRYGYRQTAALDSGMQCSTKASRMLIFICTGYVA
jgi:hypothetical protein